MEGARKGQGQLRHVGHERSDAGGGAAHKLHQKVSRGRGAGAGGGHCVPREHLLLREVNGDLIRSEDRFGARIGRGVAPEAAKEAAEDGVDVGGEEHCRAEGRAQEEALEGK